jgi:hypothetical protein
MTPLPKAPGSPAPSGISAQTLADRIDQFLASRGYRPPEPSSPARPPERDRGSESPQRLEPRIEQPQVPEAFVCEEDVRLALRAGRNLVVGEKTIITPAAKDLGESNKVFVQAGWPR